MGNRAGNNKPRLVSSDPESQQGIPGSASYLDLCGDQGALDSWREGLAGLEIAGHVPASLEEANILAEARGLAFAVCELPADPGTSLSSLFELRASHSLPLVLIGHRELGLDEREALRRAGVAAVVGSGSAPQDHELFASQLTNGASWLRRRSDIRENDIAQLLQEMARTHESRLLLACCPHAPALTAQAWDAELPSACQKDDSCLGWSGRVYVFEGEPYFAETPGGDGLEALAALLAMEKGALYSCGAFIEPAGRNLWPDSEKSLESIFLAASDMPPARTASAKGKEEAMTDRPPERRTEEEIVEELFDAEFDSGASLAPNDGVVATGPGPSSLRGASPDKAEHDGVAESRSAEASTWLTRVRGASASLDSCTRADQQGNVLHSVGHKDPAESCAIALLGDVALSKAADSLGLGQVLNWSTATESARVYFHRVEHGFLVLTGSETENQASVMGRIGTAARAFGEVKS